MVKTQGSKARACILAANQESASGEHFAEELTVSLLQR